MAKLNGTLVNDLGRLLDAASTTTKRDIVAQHPGLRSPQVCVVLCEQAEEEFMRGGFDDGMTFLRDLKLILQFNCGVHLAAHADVATSMQP